MYHVLRKAIEQKVYCYDFGLGEENYKYLWAADEYRVRSVNISKKPFYKNIIDLLRKKVRLRTRIKKLFNNKKEETFSEN